jgi:hypothetical protein
MSDVISIMEYLKNGVVISTIYGNYRLLLINHPDVIVFANEPPMGQLLSEDK